MSAPTLMRGLWMGMGLALCLGTGSVRAQSSAPKDSGSTGSSGPASSTVKAKKKVELTAEQKIFEQTMKAFRANSDRMNAESIKAARKRDKARREKEKANRTPRSVSGGSSSNGGVDPGNQGDPVTDSSAGGKGGKGK